jgi:digeranylgeranylglycerophospholipid reductase
VGSCRQWAVEAPDGFGDNCTEFHFSAHDFPLGYGWLFPKSETVANFGVMIDGRVGGDAGRYITRFARKRLGGKDRFTILRRGGGCIPLALPPARTFRGNLMLAGDAARMTNPIAGAGIANALVSGTVAGRLAAEGLKATGGKTGDDLRRELEAYDDLWRKRIYGGLVRGADLKGKYLSDDASIEKFFRRLPVAAGLMRLSPGLVERILMSRVGL